MASTDSPFDDTRFRRTPLGLWVPADPPQATPPEQGLPLVLAQRILPESPTLVLPFTPKAPVEMGAYVTEADLGLRPLEHAEVVAALTEMPSEITFIALAGLLRRVWGMKLNAGEHLALAREIYGDDAPVIQDMAQFCAEEGHVIFSEQGLFALLSHAVVYCRDDTTREFSELEQDGLKRLLVAAAGLLHDDPDGGELGEYSEDAPEEWLAYLVQNLLFNARANFGSGLARTWRLFGELARDTSRAWTSPMPMDELVARMRLTIEQQLTLAFGLYAVVGIDGNRVLIAPEGWRDLVARIAPESDPDDVIAHIAATPEQMRTELTSPEAMRLDPQLRWASVPFLERPFLRLHDDHLLLVSPRALEAWPTDGVYYRLLRAAIELDPDRGAQRFTAFAGELTEAYTIELLESEHAAARQRYLTSGRVERAKPLGRNGGEETTDVFAVADGDVVLLEISSSRITAPTRLSGDIKILQRDMVKLVTKRVRQLDRTVNALLAGDVVLDDLDRTKIRRIFPVIINVEPLRWTPPLHAYLRREVPGLLQQPAVQPLQFIELEDLEALLSALGPASLADLIASKIQAAGVDLDIQHWLHSHPAAPRVARPATVTAHLTDAFRAITRQAGFDEDEAERRLGEMT